MGSKKNSTSAMTPEPTARSSRRVACSRVTAAGSPPPRRPARGARGRTGRAPAGRAAPRPPAASGRGWRPPPAPDRRRRARAARPAARPMAAARRGTRPRRRRSTGRARPSRRARPGRGRWPRTRRGPAPHCSSNSASGREGQVELGRVAGGEAGRAGRAVAADDDRRAGLLHGLGQARGVLDLVVAAGEREPLADRVRPQPGDDGELLLQALEALAEGREGDGVGLVLGLVPARAEAELDPAAAHLVDLRHGDREGTGVAERGRRDERAEADRGGLAGEPGQRDPGVRRAREAVGVRPSPGSGRSGRSASKPRRSAAWATARRSS